MKKRLLWVGDAVVASGFAKVTHQVLDVLRHTWDVTVLGLNYHGDPHPNPFPIYPCSPGGDAFGVGRIAELAQKTRADVIMLLNDPWNVPAYIHALKTGGCGDIPVVGFIAVDGKNCRGTSLSALSLAVFWTEFGQREARRGGYTGPSAVVPCGVDVDLYRPHDRQACREEMGFERRDGQPVNLRDAFIVLNVNRNQPRKRLDLTISFFAEWVKTHDVPNAYLYLHVAPTGDHGWDCRQLAQYFGIEDRLILHIPEIGFGIPEADMPKLYSQADVLLTTSTHEGWSLPTMEAMACGIVPIVGDWAAPGEWCGDGAVKIPCTELAATDHNINVIGGVPDREETIAALDRLYRDLAWRDVMSARARAQVMRPEYRWPAIGARFDAVLAEWQAYRDAAARAETIEAEEVSA